MDVKFGDNASHPAGYMYEYEHVGRPLVYTNASLKAMFDAGDRAGLATAVAYLTSWFNDAAVWYGDAIGRTSGGKQGRRYDEAAMIKDFEKPMVPLATAYLNSLAAKDQASMVSSLPGFVSSLPGAQVPNATYRNAEVGQPAAPSLLLPIGAAIAAFLYLKGH